MSIILVDFENIRLTVLLSSKCNFVWNVLPGTGITQVRCKNIITAGISTVYSIILPKITRQRFSPV